MSNTAIIKLLLVLAHADKSFHTNEKNFLEKVLKGIDFPRDEYNKILTQVIESPKSYKDQCLELVTQIKDDEKRKATLRLLAELAASDFVLHEDEILLLQIIADEWGMYKERLSV